MQWNHLFLSLRSYDLGLHSEVLVTWESRRWNLNSKSQALWSAWTRRIDFLDIRSIIFGWWQVNICRWIGVCVEMSQSRKCSGKHTPETVQELPTCKKLKHYQKTGVMECPRLKFFLDSMTLVVSDWVVVLFRYQLFFIYLFIFVLCSSTWTCRTLTFFMNFLLYLWHCGRHWHSYNKFFHWTKQKRVRVGLNKNHLNSSIHYMKTLGFLVWKVGHYWKLSPLPHSSAWK